LKPGTQNPEPETSLSESLAWLDYCLGETAAAMAAVQEGALEAMKTPGSTGWKPVLPGGTLGPLEHYHEICEAAAGIITLKGKAARWGRKYREAGIRAGSD
jgi:hypothetical protein